MGKTNQRNKLNGGIKLVNRSSETSGWNEKRDKFKRIAQSGRVDEAECQNPRG